MTRRKWPRFEDLRKGGSKLERSNFQKNDGMPLLPLQSKVHWLPGDERYCSHEALRKRPDSPEEEVRGQTLRDGWTDWQALGDTVETAQRCKIHYAVRKKEIRRGIIHTSKNPLRTCEDARNRGLNKSVYPVMLWIPLVTLRSSVSTKYCQSLLISAP